MHNFELANQNLGFSDSSEEEIMGGPKVLLKNQILGLALPSFLKHLASPYASLDLDCFNNNTGRFCIMK